MKEDINNYSSEINADISYPKISEKDLLNKVSASHILPSSRDQNLYKKFELFLSKNKFHLNNDYDRNNAQIFLKEKNQVMANIDLDDYIEGEEEKTVVENSNNSYIQNRINANVRKNNIDNNNQIKNDNKNKQNNNKIGNNNENKKLSQNQSFEGGIGGGPPGSLFDTGKADLLCLLLGMSNK